MRGYSRWSTDAPASGLGVFGRGDVGPGPNLRRMLAGFMARHPRLRTAHPVGSNPVTGEGIDLALESGELAATAVDAALRGRNTGLPNLAPYDRSLRARFGSFFREVHLLLRLAMRPRGLDILIRQASREPHLARAIAGINLGVVSRGVAFSPRTWWDILT